MLLVLAAAIAVLAAQPPATVQSPYLDAVRLYGPGREAEAIAALAATRIDAPGRVIEELEQRVCASLGARSCYRLDLQRAGREVPARVHRTWRLLYPRALGLHIEALGAIDPRTDPQAIEKQRVIVLRLLARMDELGRDPAVLPGVFSSTTELGRHLLVWVLQYFRHEPGLALTLAWFDEAYRQDRELRLAQGALEELRTMPDAVRKAPRLKTLDTPLPRETVLAQEETRRLHVAVRTYEQLLAADPGVLEAHLRLARLLLRLGRHEDAEPHLRQVAALGPDARQVYLSQLFQADVLERRGDRAGAIAAYLAAQAAWPGAQAPAIALSRLRVLDRDGAGGRRALTAIRRERDRRERSDPWVGYMSVQAWRLPGGLAALQGSFEPLR
jgi:tetratricopeptide (TPR) repeat protein